MNDSLVDTHTTRIIVLSDFINRTTRIEDSYNFHYSFVGVRNLYDKTKV
jgi:hypothetical protein